MPDSKTDAPETSAQTAPGALVAAGSGPGPAPPRWLAWAGRHAYLLLALLCLALWLPGILSLPPIDRDESRFAQSSRQMLDSGNYVDIRFGQVPRYKKPVGIYWLQAAATGIAGLAGSHFDAVLSDHARIWTYRLPSLLGGIAAVWATVWCASLFGAEAGFLAGLLLALTILLTAEASMATTDAALLAATTIMQGVLLRLYHAAPASDGKPDDAAPSPSGRTILWGWAAMAAGILLKGPVTPGVALATIIALVGWDSFARKPRKFDGKWLARIRPLSGLALTVLLVAPWLVAIALQSHGAFFQQSLGGDFAAKVAGEQEGHGAPPGYYLVIAALSLWPAILFVAPAIGAGLARRTEPAIRFLIAWAFGWWLLVELVPTKLPNYALPACPALAALAAVWLLSPPVPQSGWRRVLPFLSALQFLAGLGLLAAAPVLLIQHYADPSAPLAWPPLAASGVAALCGLAALITFLLGRRLVPLALALAATVTIVPTLTAVTAPSLTQFWLSPQLAALVAKNRQPGDPPPMLAGYEEPSLVFALGADTALTDGAGAAQLGADKGGLALVDDAERPEFLAHLAELEANASALDDLTGFNYSRGRAAHVTLYRVAPLHPVPRPLAP